MTGLMKIKINLESAKIDEESNATETAKNSNLKKHKTKAEKLNSSKLKPMGEMIKKEKNKEKSKKDVESNINNTDSKLKKDDESSVINLLNQKPIINSATTVSLTLPNVSYDNENNNLEVNNKEERVNDDNNDNENKDNINSINNNNKYILNKKPRRWEKKWVLVPNVFDFTKEIWLQQWVIVEDNDEEAQNYFLNNPAALDNYYESFGSRLKETAPRKYQCNFDECGKIFVDASSLKKHMLTHGEKQYLCKYEGCGKKFLDNSKLRRHQLVHTGEKPFKCDLCGKKFSLDFNLKTHLRTHTGEKPYICSFAGCDRRFTQSSNLTAHERTHKEMNEGEGTVNGSLLASFTEVNEKKISKNGKERGGKNIIFNYNNHAKKNKSSVISNTNDDNIENSLGDNKTDDRIGSIYNENIENIANSGEDNAEISNINSEY